MRIMSPVWSFVLGLSVVVICVGCSEESGSDPRVRALQSRLSQALARFEKADQSFGPSTNSDELIKNAYWLDRMVDAYREVELVEKESVRLGFSPVPELKAEMDQRITLHVRTLESEMKFINFKVNMEIAQEWLK